MIVLALLMRRPFHGYLIVKVTNDIIGPWAKISSGTLYPLLMRMEQAKLISVVPVEESQGAATVRHSRTFTITEEGRKRFHQVMMDMSSNLGDYQRIFRFKMVFIDLLQKQERLLLFNHYINYCQSSILYLQTEMANITYEITDPSEHRFLSNIVRSMQHMVRQLQAELEWVTELRDQELAENDQY